MKMTRKARGISRDTIFKHIKSIGFEIETTDIIKFTVKEDEGKEILVNSSLTNGDLEYGYEDEEYTYILNTPELQFKITNDSSEDSNFNEEIEALAEDEDCDDVVFKLSLPENEYLNQEYDIKIVEDGELLNCSSFTDVEWIITHYRPRISPNIILETFSESMVLLRNHLRNLVIIPDSHFLYLSDGDFVKYDNANVNQTYVLPGTSLVYFNSLYTNSEKGETRGQNYNINEDLLVVVQMTFGCDVLYVYRLMKKMLSLEFTKREVDILEECLTRHPENKNIKEIVDFIEEFKSGENSDITTIDNSLEIVKIMFTDFPVVDKKIKMYFFLIIYKIYIYLNFYLTDKPKDLLKEVSSFMVRHTNYVLYLEIKKLFGGHESTINQLIEKLDSKEITELFVSDHMNKKIKKIFLSKPSRPKSYGNPLYSVANYFRHFEKDVSKDLRDWFVLNNIDEKSTKYDLTNDTIIIEFRDFPIFCYMQFLLEDDIREELLDINTGSFTMKIINKFISRHRHSKTRKSL